MLVRLNKKKLIFLSAGGFLLLLLFFIYLYFSIPAIIESKIQSGLENQFGFAQVKVVERKSSTLVLESISLDKDEFNTIQSIHARYNFFSLILFGKLDKITINSPSLTYSLNSQSLIQTPKDLIENINLSSDLLFKANIIEVSKGSLDILTPEWGGFHFDFDAQLRALDKKSRALTANLRSNQKLFSTNIQIDGEINLRTGWNIDANLDRSRLEIPGLQISRSSGRMSISGSENGFFANGEFSIGGFKIGEFAWSDIAATFEQTENNFQWVVAGNALGNKDIEFGLNYNRKDPLNIYGTLYTKKLADLLQYLNNEETETLKTSPIAQINDAFFTYSLPIKTLFDDKKNIIFSFKKPEQGIDLKGNLFIDANGFIIRALMSPTYVSKISPGYEGILVNKGLMSASLNYSSRPNDSNNNIFIMNLKDGVVSIGPILLTDIQTSLSLTPPETLRMENYAEAFFRLHMKNTIEQKGSLQFKMGDSLSLQNINYQIFGGDIRLDKVEIASLPDRFNVKATTIDISRLFRTINDKIEASGSMNMKGVLKIDTHTAYAENLILESTKSGTLSIPEEFTKIIFKDKSIDHEMAIEALQNFDYDYFKLTFNGDLNTNASIKITVKGRNQNLLNNRPILINMTLDNQNLDSLWQAFSHRN